MDYRLAKARVKEIFAQDPNFVKGFGNYTHMSSIDLQNIISTWDSMEENHEPVSEKLESVEETQTSIRIIDDIIERLNELKNVIKDEDDVETIKMFESIQSDLMESGLI